MLVEGEGYKLNRPHLTDFFWVRFVDGSRNELATPVGIPAKDLEFDSFKWKTPQVASAGPATMQISLNNQDWHDAKDPNGSGFNYYQSPHVT